MHFAIFLRNLLKLFENSLASLGRSPPDPLRGRPPKVLSLCKNPGGAPLNENCLNNVAIFQPKLYFSLKNYKIFKIPFLGGGVAAPRTPWQSAHLQVTTATNEIKFVCTTPCFELPPKTTKILHNTLTLNMYLMICLLFWPFLAHPGTFFGTLRIDAPKTYLGYAIGK